MAEAPMIEGDEPADAQSTTPDANATPVEVGYCLKCGYDMRGLGVQKCPECGTAFDANEVRLHNHRWCNELARRMRISHLIIAVAVVNAALFLLTGGLNVPMAAFIGMIGLTMLVIHLITWFPLWRMREQLQDQNGLAHRCGSFIAIVGANMIVVPLTAVWGRSGVVVALVAGLLFAALQAQHYLEGKRRGNLFGVSSAVAESVGFTIGVSKFFGAVAVILLVAVLAVR